MERCEVNRVRRTVVSITGSECLGHRSLRGNVVQPVDVRLIGVGWGIAVGGVRRASSGAVVDVWCWLSEMTMR